MTRVGKNALAGVVCLLLLPTVSWAQGSTAASVTGTVKDSSGAVLPGVTVEAASPALIEKVRTTVTDDKGEYRIIELRPGTYTVSFTLPGFSVFKREGLELGSGFTATVNADLKVGGLEETVTVSGQTPLVDTQTVSQQQTISKSVLDAVPTGKGLYGFVALMPAAVVPSAQQDVGGNLGDSTVRISVHGARTSDMRQLIDGLSFNLANGDGNARGFYVNPLSAQEIIVDQAGSGGQAEYGVGGAIVNLISRDGGNQFSGTVFASGSTDNLQGNNIDDNLRSQGLTSPTISLRIYDLNGFIGGPIKQDKLWFASAHRRSGQSTIIPNLYKDANVGARVFGAPASVWKYAPDPNAPVEPHEDNQAHNIRLIWQATASNKVTFSYDWQWNRTQNNVGTLYTGTAAWEANPTSNDRCTEENLFQTTWTHPHTSKLLFEAGFNYLYHRQQTASDGTPCPNGVNAIQITDVGTNFTYNGVNVNGVEWQYPSNQRVSMSYVTGSHNFKTGLIATDYLKPTYTNTDRGPNPLFYTFNNGVPTGLTQFVSPQILKTGLHAALGVFAQDQWRIHRMTLNLGLRYDYVNAYAPALQEPGGPLYDPISFPEVGCLPCWHDISPRVGVVYDVFGNGRTAIKASFGRYVSSNQAGLAEQFRPAISAVNSTTRSWTDTNGNFFPDCNLRDPLLNGECGPMANATFGGVQVRTTPDPNWITGWGNRGYNWQTGASIQHEVRPGMAVSFGFYRTTWGNFTVTDNKLVTPADYDPYCITAPTDSRLGSVSGQQMCGFYDIKPTLFGQVNNVVTLAKNYGDESEYYNGADVSATVRLPHGGQLMGGWNVGNSVSLPNSVGFISNNLSRCFVVDSPQDQFHPLDLLATTQAQNGCRTANPYLSRFKINGSYPLPWSLQAAIVYQSLPGTPYNALFTVSTAAIQPSLGRPLAGGTRQVIVQLLPPYSAYLDQRVNQFDFRLSKIMKLGKARLQGNLDLYNMFNTNTVLQLIQQYGQSYLRPTQTIAPRLLKLGVQIDF